MTKFSLEDPITKLPQISSHYSKRLEKLSIFTIKDLLTYFPREYKDSTEITLIESIKADNLPKESIILKVRVDDFKNIKLRGGKSFQKALMSDETGSIECLWFNQPFLTNVMRLETEFLISGKVKLNGKKLQISVSNYEQILESRNSIHLGRIVPEYNLTEGISKKWFRNRIQFLIKLVKNRELVIPFELTSQMKFVDLYECLYQIHFPENQEKLENSNYYLSLIELINIHLKVLKNKENKKIGTYLPVELKAYSKELGEFIKKLPFTPTTDQIKTIQEIELKLSKNETLNQLVQGDVGSGKTLIAIYLSYLFYLNSYQTIILAPTTILAKQHYNTFSNLLNHIKKDIALITSETDIKKPFPIIIGTSAILARKPNLIKDTGLIVVDEQHRFGVNQREELLKPFKKNIDGKAIHYLNMTATPIPRTIAETFFSDLEVNTINSKPKGRVPIKTFVIKEDKRIDCINWIKSEIKDKNIQVFWICPLIEDSEKLEAKSVKKAFDELREYFNEEDLVILHGQIKTNEKDKIMKRFARNEFKVLISTTVIEVGIDIPNATIMVIENPERYGLAQLHQIRGRVGRGDLQSWCFLLNNEDISSKALDRLNFFAKTDNGLEIAEFDLNSRGPGEVYGTKQSGIPSLKIAKLNNLKLIKESKKIATLSYNNKIKTIQLFS